MELERRGIEAGCGELLSRKPARLLTDFDWPAAASVVAIECGCGAVSRLLGERCARVQALVSDDWRAHLADLRNRDLETVSVASIESMQADLGEPVDLVVCSRAVLDAHGELRSAECGRELAAWAYAHLTPQGALVAGVDLSAAGDDALSMLRERLSGTYDGLDFYFPYPDHRSPDCLLAETFFDRVDARELVAGHVDAAQRAAVEQIPSTALPGVAASVLVVASRGSGPGVRFPQLGVMYGVRRPAAPELEAKTRFVEDAEGNVRSLKSNLSGESPTTVGELTHHACDDPWMPGASLQADLLQRAVAPGVSLETIFEPVRPWLQTLERLAHGSGDEYWLPGRYLDATWQNTFIQDGRCRFIDLEWEWRAPIRLRVLLIRSMTYLLDEAQRRGVRQPQLLRAARKRLMHRIAHSLGVPLNARDFADYARIDAAFYVTLEGGDPKRARLYAELKLHNRNLFDLVSATRGWVARLADGLRRAG